MSSSNKKESKKKKEKPVLPYSIDKDDTGSVVNEPMAIYATTVNAAAVGILKYLGGKNTLPPHFTDIHGAYDFIAMIRKGISRLSLDYLMNATGISTDEMAAIMHTSGRTLRRYTADTLLNPEQSERAIELARLYSRGEETFGSASLFKQWMEGNILALGNKKPKEFLDTSIGIDMLMNELGRIEHGVFA